MNARLTALLGLLLVAVGAFVLAGDVALAPAPAPSPTPTGFATSRPPTTAVATASPGPRAIPEGYRIQIPRLGIDLPVHEGDIARDVDKQQTPENAAFHLPGTAIFGEGGNTYLYAHARTGMFLALWNAREGDEVLVSTPDGRVLAYVIRDVRPRVAPNDVSVAAPAASERLTLQTSTGPNPQDPRFVAIAFPK